MINAEKKLGQAPQAAYDGWAGYIGTSGYMLRILESPP